jgi:hypothetical protein
MFYSPTDQKEHYYPFQGVADQKTWNTAIPLEDLKKSDSVSIHCGGAGSAPLDLWRFQRSAAPSATGITFRAVGVDVKHSAKFDASRLMEQCGEIALKYEAAIKSIRTIFTKAQISIAGSVLVLITNHSMPNSKKIYTHTIGGHSVDMQVHSVAVVDGVAYANAVEVVHQTTKKATIVQILSPHTWLFPPFCGPAAK